MSTLHIKVSLRVVFLWDRTFNNSPCDLKSFWSWIPNCLAHFAFTRVCLSQQIDWKLLESRSCPSISLASIPSSPHRPSQHSAPNYAQGFPITKAKTRRALEISYLHYLKYGHLSQVLRLIQQNTTETGRLEQQKFIPDRLRSQDQVPAEPGPGGRGLSFYKGICLIIRVPFSKITSPRCHHWGLGLRHMTSGGRHKHSVPPLFLKSVCIPMKVKHLPSCYM